METAYRLPYYGFVHFLPCICDYPMSNTPAQIFIGNRELVMKIRTVKGEVKEGTFKVTKMRCWRIMTVANNEPEDLNRNTDENNDATDTKMKLELSFEYLMNNRELQWITVISSQAILMSLCLQSIVEELLRMRNGIKIKKVCMNNWNFKHLYALMYFLLFFLKENYSFATCLSDENDFLMALFIKKSLLRSFFILGYKEVWKQSISKKKKQKHKISAIYLTHWPMLHVLSDSEENAQYAERWCPVYFIIATTTHGY